MLRVQSAVVLVVLFATGAIAQERRDDHGNVFNFRGDLVSLHQASIGYTSGNRQLINYHI